MNTNESKMTEPTIIHVVGNRPQFIKLAVLFDAIRKRTTLRQFIIHTGQHYSSEMSDIFFDELSIPVPDAQLEVNAPYPDEFIGEASSKIYSLLSERPLQDIVLVYGDTNSTLAAALAARRNGNRLFHFESGVRTMDKSMPEEINRMLTDRLSCVHYCCTELNRTNLLNEGYGDFIPSDVICTGDLMLDAFSHISASKKKVVHSENYIACTIHRARNITNKRCLEVIANALNKIHEEMEVVIPLHPHTAKRLKEFNLQLNCTVMKPLGYQEMKRFICDATYMITDSGGACREAFFAKKRSLIIMESPFWPEIVAAGAALNCQPVEADILHNFLQLKSLNSTFDINIFGDGNAAERIADHLNNFAHPR